MIASVYISLVLSTQVVSDSQTTRKPTGTIAVYSNVDKVTDWKKAVLRLSNSSNIEQELSKSEETAWLKIDEQKNWFLVTSTYPEHSYEMSKVPELALKVISSGGGMKISDLAPDEKENFCSRMAMSANPYIGNDTVLHAGVTLTSSISIGNKKVELSIRSKGTLPTISQTSSARFSKKEWERFRQNEEQLSRADDEKLLNSMFSFSQWTSLKEKSEFLGLAALRLPELIRIRNRKIAERAVSGINKLFPDWSEGLNKSVDFKSLSNWEQDDMSSQLFRSGAFESKQAAKEWLTANPLLPLGVHVSIGAGSMGLGWSYP